MSGEREAYEREAEGSAVRILVADDDPLGRELLTAFVERLGYAALAVEDGAAALEAVRACAPDLVLSDVSMPGMNGFDLCRRLKGDADMRLIPVVLITGIGEEFKRQGIEAGADEFLSKPVSLEELRLRLKALLRMKAFTDDLESAEAVLCTLGRSIEAKDAYTEGHCERLAGYAAALGEALGLGPPEMRALRLGGSLHDLGKVGIPEAVLLKAGPLTPEEWAIMQRHPILATTTSGGTGRATPTACVGRGFRCWPGCSRRRISMTP
jgi:putative two-component system response regulator